MSRTRVVRWYQGLFRRKTMIPLFLTNCDPFVRRHPTRRVDEVGLPSRERSAPPGADRGVAGITGGRDRRARAPPSNDPRQGRTARDPARVPPVTVVVKSVYASFRARLEGAGA